MGNDVFQQQAVNTPARLVLVLGGCRSGKSSFALRFAEGRPGRKIFVATCPVLDDEMAKRILRHRREREGRGWETIEEEIDLRGAVAGCDREATVLVDCLTLWTNNLQYRCETAGRLLEEDAAARRAAELADAALARSGLTVAVANEVGLGIVPGDAVSRRFRDCAGRINQTIAARADEVHFMVAGLPVKVK